MAMEIINKYADYAAQSMAEGGSATADRVKKRETEKTPEAVKAGKKESTQAYLKKLQNQVPYMTLEIGSSLSMNKDKRGGVLTVNPKLLERMQNDPQAEKEFTQRMKDIERAERTANAYYNSLGGCVERTSHWYMDENGKFSHFAYTVRDDKYNKKIREEAKKNSEEFIKRTREKAAKRKKELTEANEKKRLEAQESAKKEEAKKEETAKGETADKTVISEDLGQILEKKMTPAEGGMVYMNHTDIQEVMDAINGKAAGKAGAKEQIAAGANLDLQV